MKKIFTFAVPLFIVISLAFVSVGCLGLETTESQDLAIKKLARIAGITLALEKPKEVDKVLSYLKYVEELDDAKLKQAAIDIAVKYAYDKYEKTSKTVILMAEVVDLATILIPDTGSTEIDARLINIAVRGFTEGINLAK